MKMINISLLTIALISGHAIAADSNAKTAVGGRPCVNLSFNEVGDHLFCGAPV